MMSVMQRIAALLNMRPLGRNPKDKRDYLRCPSKYMPHQGKREMARRLAQRKKREIENDN